MIDLLDRLDAHFEHESTPLINQIRQAWNSRDIPQYDAVMSSLFLFFLYSYLLK